MARRSKSRIQADEQEIENALAYALEIMASHADHPHYGGVCFVPAATEFGNSRIMAIVPDTSPFTPREHRLAYMLKRVCELPKRRRIRGEEK